MRLLAIAFAFLAIVGLTAVVTHVGLVVAVHVSDVKGPAGDAGWWVIISGYLGACAALFFGTLALLIWQRQSRQSP